MRYDKVRLKNLKRDEAIRKFYADNPGYAYQEIADMFGLNTRQRVFQIIHGKKKVKAR